MEIAGIVRRMDDLGRIVLPKEIRRMLRIQEGDQLEIFTDREKEIVLRKYSPLREWMALAKVYAEVLAKVAMCPVCICDTEQVIAAGGEKRKNLEGELIGPSLRQCIEDRIQYKNKTEHFDYKQQIERIRAFQSRDEIYYEKCIVPIISAGDALGAVLFLSVGEQQTFTEADQKLCECAAYFLGKEMEQ